MPFMTNWDEFARAAELLYEQEPAKTRVCLKYRHQDGKLVFNVTDDAVCLKYLAVYAQDVKKIDRLTGQLMRLMASRDK